MKAPVPRGSTRRTTLAAVCLGLILGGTLVARRAMDFRQRASEHAVLAESGLRISPHGDFEGRLTADQVAHHARLARKYDRAAARPWWPVLPDPDEPEAESLGAPTSGSSLALLRQAPRSGGL